MHAEDEEKCTPPPPRQPSSLPPPPAPSFEALGPDPWDQELRRFAPNWSHPTTQTHLNKRIARPPAAVLPGDRQRDTTERRPNQWLLEAERMTDLLIEHDDLRYPYRASGRPHRILRATRRLPSQVTAALQGPSTSTPEQTMALESALPDCTNA